MARVTLKASPEGLHKAKASLRRFASKIALADLAGLSRTTVQAFFAGKEISVDSFRQICEALELPWEAISDMGTEALSISPTKTEQPLENKSDPALATPNPTPASSNPEFIGRESAVADLNTRIRQGAKVIVIQAPGGVGKTTLAQEFLSSRKFEVVLDLPMAKEEANITPVESVVEEWLKRDFGEEPGRDFGVMLGRLKRQLQTKRVGVLIDNLEPALDEQGRFIAPHRRYVELLRVLADASVKSLTLITSREPLAEGLSISSYSLPSLGEEAWANFFGSRGLEVEATILKEIHRAYGGNALAMTILCDPIQRDGGMGAYWQEHKIEAGLLVELAVENLVKEQFNRLEEIYTTAYRLLCRLGCYRYQAVPTVPREGLLCLLWDVPESQRTKVIESLRNRVLVECQQGEYALHPVILAEAISRLRASADWEVANQKAAEFWKSYFNEILTVKDANFAFEAFYHYVEIEDFDSSVELIFCNYLNDSKLPVNHRKMIGAASVGLGLNHESIYSIKRISDKISNSYYLGELWRFSGTSHHHLGNLKKSIDCHEKSLWHINKYLTENPFKDKNPLFFRLKRLQIACLVGFSHCLVDLGETEKASQNLEECLLMSDLFISEAKETFIDSFLGVFYSIEHFHDMFLEIYSVLSFLKALDGCNGKAHCLAEKVEVKLPLINKYKMTQGYGSFFLGLTYKNLGEIKKSFEMYNNSVSYAAESHNIEVKGKALTGLAELYRLQSDFEKALSHNRESIKLLEEIGAKCDLAEAYYQLALTYQAMGEPDQSQEYFTKAIHLYEEMEAPKQVEKVRRAIENKL